MEMCCCTQSMNPSIRARFPQKTTHKKAGSKHRSNPADIEIEKTLGITSVLRSRLRCCYFPKHP